MTCDKCGEIHDPTRCSKHSSRTHKQCTKRIGLVTTRRGDLVCFTHGGESPQVKKAIAVRKAEAKARDHVEFLGQIKRITPVTNPVAVLMELAGEFVSVKEHLVEQVATLTELRYRGETEQIRGELAAYERSLDRTERILVNLVKLDLAEREVRVNEGMANVLIEALEAGLAEIGLNETQREAAKRGIGRHLRLLEESA